MFLGHFGAGFAAKKAAQAPSLGTLFMAAQFIDLLWPLFLILGIEKVAVEPGISAVTPLNFIYYPFTHSLLGTVIWALLFSLSYYLLKKNLKVSLILGLLVLSHWILDLLVHIPDLPLTFGGDEKVGFGIWNSFAATLLLEGFIFGIGFFIYQYYTNSKNKKGVFSLWGLMIFLLIIYIMNLFGDPPPDQQVIGYAGLLQWLIVLWGYWIDKNRAVKV